MAHFAQLNENNIVINVIVVSNEDIMDENGFESEQIGIQFCKNLHGEDTKWVQTSYNDNFRFRFAGIGMTYSETYDAFIPINPYPNSWYFEESQLKYKPPVKMPKDGKIYYWNEDILNWSLNMEATSTIQE
ncbi:MAG: hypothetical protein EBU90_21125 [Proteobacteria bacterium]|nr:hypothetical protein [Pseudomonadota bacterium]